VDEYDGRQVVGIDLHRRRSVIVRMTEGGARLDAVRIDNDPLALAAEIAKAGEAPEVVLEATYGWYWAVDVLQSVGASVHLAHPLGVKGFAYRRVKNDVRDAADLADLLRMGRLPEAWIAPAPMRQLWEAVRHRAKLVALRTGLKAPGARGAGQVGRRDHRHGSVRGRRRAGARRAGGHHPGPAVRGPGRLAAPPDQRADLQDRHGRAADHRAAGRGPGIPRCAGPRRGRPGVGRSLSR
jgi:transposase